MSIDEISRREESHAENAAIAFHSAISAFSACDRFRSQRADERGGAMTFHPSMDYGRGHHLSARAVPEEGPPFTYTAANRATLDELFTHYPPEQRKSAILAAVYLVQAQQGYVTGNGMRHVAEVIGCTSAEVE